MYGISHLGNSFTLWSDVNVHFYDIPGKNRAFKFEQTILPTFLCRLGLGLVVINIRILSSSYLQYSLWVPYDPGLCEKRRQVSGWCTLTLSIVSPKQRNLDIELPQVSPTHHIAAYL